MNRISILAIWVSVIVVAAFGVYKVKYEVLSIRAEIAEKSKELAQEKETLRVVEAELAYLNRPDRLRRLSDKYLNNENLTVGQIAEVEAIPFKAQQQAANDDEDKHILPVNYHRGEIIP